MFRISVVLLAIVFATSLRAQDSVSAVGVTVASVIPATAIGAALYQNYADFWKNAAKVPFHVSPDPPYAYHNDKFGHAYYTGFVTSLVKEGYMVAGMDRKKAVWYGATAALVAQTMVEIGDAYTSGAPHTGFSPGDEIANVLGAGFQIGKEYVPYMRNFDYKLGFYPSDAYKQGAYESILDDNECRTYWLSYNLSHDIDAQWYPKWLNIAVGHSVENLINTLFLPSRQGKHPTTLGYIGFDLNLRGLPIEGKAWNVIVEILSHFRVPFPALQFAPAIKWHWLKP